MKSASGTTMASEDFLARYRRNPFARSKLVGLFTVHANANVPYSRPELLPTRLLVDPSAKTSSKDYRW